MLVRLTLIVAGKSIRKTHVEIDLQFQAVEVIPVVAVNLMQEK